MTMNIGIEWKGVDAFHAAARLAEHELAVGLAPAVEEAATPTVYQPAVETAPRRSGRLAGSGDVTRIANGVRIGFDAPYAAGSELGQRGKWSGFRRYGPRGKRWFFRAVDEGSHEFAAALWVVLRPILTLGGWFRGR